MDQVHLIVISKLVRNRHPRHMRRNGFGPHRRLEPDDSGIDFRRYSDTFPESSLKVTNTQTGLVREKIDPSPPVVAHDLVRREFNGVTNGPRQILADNELIRNSHALLKRPGIT